jgi:deoxyribonuclease-4
MKRVIVHSSYLINLSADTEEKMTKSHGALVSELHRSQKLGVHGVVLHPGSHLGAGEDEGVKTIAESLDTVFEITADLYGDLLCGERQEAMKILLENTAGQGTNIGYRFSHLSDIMKYVKAENRSRLGVCLDTCHAFAAGHDISTDAGWDLMWKEYDELLPAESLQAVHVNDSLRGCGSRRDRHAGIAQGEIGEVPFRRLMKDERFHGIPMTLETPSGMDGWAAEIAKMRSWET